MSRWRYKLERDFTYETKIPIELPKGKYAINWMDKNGQLWISIEKDGTIDILQGYSWNGCSPNISICDLFWVGTPDGVIDVTIGKPVAYYASMIHDALYQMLYYKVCPYTRKQADKIFYNELKKRKFKLAGLYWLAVRMLGWIFVPR